MGPRQTMTIRARHSKTNDYDVRSAILCQRGYSDNAAPTPLKRPGFHALRRHRLLFYATTALAFGFGASSRWGDLVNPAGRSRLDRQSAVHSSRFPVLRLSCFGLLGAWLFKLSPS